MSLWRVGALMLVPVLLAACGGEDSSMQTPGPAPSLIYSYPADGQRDVSPRADLVLRFSQPVDQPELALKAGDERIDHELTPVDGGQSWVIHPVADLKPAATYSVSLQRPVRAGETVIEQLGSEGSLEFQTRGSFSGVPSLSGTAADFGVEGRIPDGERYPLVDFSTLRLTFSQPVHPAGVVYGESVRLEDSAGNLVPARVLSGERHLVIDPVAETDAAEFDLNPGETYRLVVRDLPNTYGDQLANYETTLTPQDSGPGEILYQAAVANSDAEDLRSVLNGERINGIALSSVLLGDTPTSYQTGEMWAELAYAPDYPEMTPLKIPAGTLLSSTSLDVNVGGVVPLMTNSGVQKTGTIRVTTITDAVGYLYRNPYSDADDAPRHIRLFMDVAMSTEEAQPNAALSQNILGLELVGTAIIRNGTLEIDALSMVEPRLLGLEHAVASLAFRIEADTLDRAQQNAPDPLVDTQGPELLSWMPDETGTGLHNAHRPGDPITLFFDEPVSRGSLAEGLRVLADGKPVEALDVSVDGTSVSVMPAGGLAHGTHYQIRLTSDLTDMAGNGAVPEELSFELPVQADPSAASPLAVAVYPGFPCVTKALDLLNDQHGRCIGAFDGNGVDYNQDDESMPVVSFPANRPIAVTFSQSMDTASIRLNQTFTVEKVTSLGDGTGGNVEVAPEPVAGRLEMTSRKLWFYPEQPWEQGAWYRYTLSSEASESPDCNTAICSVAGQALETDALAGLSQPGGPDMTIYFRGGATSDTVLLPLRNLPVRDVNSDGVIQCGIVDETDSDGIVIRKVYERDCTEAPDVTLDDAGQPLAPPQATRVVSRNREEARVGCNRDRKDIGSPWIETECPELQFIYMTGALNTEVVGPVDPDDPAAGVRILLHPTLLTTTSLTVHAKVGTDLTWAETPTGPQIIRMRYAEDEQGKRTRLIPGVIRTGADGFPVFETDVKIYLDAPDLATPLDLPHNLHSVPLDLDLAGEVCFLDDGRQVIEQYNQVAQTLAVDVGGIVAFDLEIPANGLRLSYLSSPVKPMIGVNSAR